MKFSSKSGTILLRVWVKHYKKEVTRENSSSR